MCTVCDANCCKKCDTIVHAPKIMWSHTRVPASERNQLFPAVCMRHHMSAELYFCTDNAPICAGA